MWNLKGHRWTLQLAASMPRMLLTAVFILCVCQRSHAQGLSLAAPFPSITANAPTGLQVNYTAGKIVVGGVITSLTAGNVTVTDAMTDCAAPSYLSCNFVYWPGSGTTLATTTTLATAFASVNRVVAFVTASGGNIASITPITITLPRSLTLSGYWVAPGACQQTVSGNSTGTNGQTIAGASFTPVIQSQTSATGTNTHTFLCNISPLVRPSSVVDATFYYGVQTSNLGTQAAVLASGTMNGSIVFATITYPSPGIGETPSTVTPVRADSGTLLITPVVASSNVNTTTAGAFYSVRFAPASPIAMAADHVQLLLTVTLQSAATSATITNSPGVFVRYTR